MDEERIHTLAEIIKEYRNDELNCRLDEWHVKNWLNQFDEDYREVILNETVHVLQEWFFGQEKLDKFLDAVLAYLCKQQLISELELLKKAVFLKTQGQMNSQTRIVERLREIVWERYGEEILTSDEIQDGIYVYLDDGLYTGAKARRDIASVISQLPEGAALYVVFLAAAVQNFNYSKKCLDAIARERAIHFQMLRMYSLANSRWVNTGIDENGNEVRSYSPIHACLWPTETVKDIPVVKEYIDSYIEPYDKKEKKLFRIEPWKNDKGIFTSLENRNIVEKEFLFKGIELAKHSRDNGLYALGFNSWPSLGFGSFCATYMNTSNTCPLVLWWGNIEKKRNILDSWYPLLPRRIGEIEHIETFEEPIEELDISYDKHDQYNLCPDCGRQFGIMEDGGNGFCIKCAWKH